jgi:hypothetical protein
MISGASPEEIAKQLADKIFAEKVFKALPGRNRRHDK